MRTLRCDLQKTLFSANFLLAAAVMLALIFSTGCVLIDSDIPQYSIGEFIFKTDRSLWISQSAYSSVNIFAAGFSNRWLGIFVPFLAAFACVPAFCDEYNSNCWRHCIERLGMKKYIISKFLCCITVSFSLIIVCYSIFGVICFCVFPMPSECYHEPFLRKWYEFYGYNVLFDSDSILLFAIGRTLTAAMVAIIGGLFCHIVSALTMNKYVSMGIPVLLYFFFAQIGNKYQYEGDTAHQIMILLDNSLRFSSLETFLVNNTKCPVWAAFIYFAAVTVLFFIIYYAVMKRRLRQ